MIQENKSDKNILQLTCYFCDFNFEEYFKFTIYVANIDSIRKNNKLSKVD